MSIVQKMPVVRSALEGWARGRRVIRRLPNGHRIYVSPDAQLKYLYKKFDVDLIAICDRYVDEKSVVWDIGSNCGVFAFSAARAQQIVAVEADPFLANLIQDSTILNGISVMLVAAAASSQQGLASFSIAKRGRASNHLTQVSGRSQTGGERGRLVVGTVTLDQLLSLGLPPTLIKIDVEGAEADVLRGASRVLHEVRPVLYLETAANTHSECEALLRTAGYTITKAAELNWLCTPPAYVTGASSSRP